MYLRIIGDLVQAMTWEECEKSEIEIEFDMYCDRWCSIRRRIINGCFQYSIDFGQGLCFNFFRFF
jgi:hypothetical protein